MFGVPTKIVGAPRAFPVKDRVVAHGVLDAVMSAQSEGTRAFRARWGDLSRVDASSSVIAVNPCGRQVFLVLTTLGNRCVVFLVHTASRAVDLVPMRFERARHVGRTVAMCTQCTRERVLVVNDVCGTHESVHARIQDVHDLVHKDHTPDAALFPLRLAARRCFSFAQISEVRRFVTRPDVRAHSLAIIGAAGTPDVRVPMTLDGQAAVEAKVAAATPAAHQHGRRSAPATGTFADALVVAAPGADAYRVRLPGTTAWEFLAVKTLAESAALAGLNLATPVTCRVVWDGASAAWRIAMFAATPPTVAP